MLSYTIATFITIVVFLLKHSSQPILKQSFNLKLGKRLQQIEQMVIAEYSQIWDCCCDHGLLGSALLSRQFAEYVHFVDIVPELMAELESKLTRFYTKNPLISSWKVHCLDVAKLPLSQYNGRHLVIIAGVGGDLMIDFIEAIHQQYPSLYVDFLLCPVHHQYRLREKLITLGFSLKGEKLVEENRRFYELLLVSSNSNEKCKISPVGDQIWNYGSMSEKYLKKTLSHYQRIMQGSLRRTQQDDFKYSQDSKTNNVQQIIDAYNAVIFK